MSAISQVPGAERIQFGSYPDCIALSNETTRVVLGHHVGGRILSYELDGENVLYFSPAEADWTPGMKNPEVSAGRFDVGPEMIQTRGATIWSGEWTAEITGERSARMTSKPDPDSGFQVVRDFVLDAGSSHLTFTQTVTNVGEKTARQCYWSRTFARHGGIAVIPLTPEKSRFPNGYVMYTRGSQIDTRPEDPAIREEGEYLVISGPPEFPKLGMDSHAGWAAYHTRENQLFVKRYEVDPVKQYGELAGLTFSLWYPSKDKIPACEVEPIGPMETLEPGESASFTAHWYLLDVPFREPADPAGLHKLIDERCPVPTP